MSNAAYRAIRRIGVWSLSGAAVAIGMAACVGGSDAGNDDGAREAVASAAASALSLGACQPADIVAHGDTTYTIKTDGTVWGWGNNAYPYPLGYSSIDPHYPDFGVKVPAPIAIPGITGAVSAKRLAATKSGACALLSDATVTCWGQRLGAAPTAPGVLPPPPVNVKTASGTLSNVTTVVAGDAHACALVTVGTSTTAWCWGDGTLGQLGAVGYAGASTTVAVPMAGPDGGAPYTDIAQIAAAGNTTCVLRSTGDILCTGSNQKGQLGEGWEGSTTEDGGDLPGAYLTPITLSGPSSGTKFVAIFGGGATNDTIGANTSHGGLFCASAVQAGSLQTTYCWGDNTQAQAGAKDWYGGTASLTPTGDGTGSLNVNSTWAQGDFNGCEVTAAGTLTCWGNNTYSQVSATDTSAVIAHAVAFTKPINVGKVTIGRAHMCAVTMTGIQCWGDNSFGQLGGSNGAPFASAPANAPYVIGFSAPPPACGNHCGTITNGCGSTDCGDCDDNSFCVPSTHLCKALPACRTPAQCCERAGGYWSGKYCE